jgi:glycosyltransferase involved in cell wall biosynthesis
MNIGYDAKRAYHNDTGLGHYSRTLIRSLAAVYPQHQYYLFNPKRSSTFSFGDVANVIEVLPHGLLNALFTSAWRSKRVVKDLKPLGIHLYHGLSHEVPIGIKATGIPSIVTIHDLIHERYPEQYNAIDVKIYSRKFRYACEQVDLIIAISEQTKRDIIDIYKVPEEKIRVCYQSCNEIYSTRISEEEKAAVRAKYELPDNYFLSVGSIIERKNLLNVCKAIKELERKMDIPLVVIGGGGAYKKLVKQYLKEAQLENRVIFLSEHPATKEPGFRNNIDFPALYQSSLAMIYTSIFEGFGIPVLEGLFSGIPVITSNISSMPEAGGDAAIYVRPYEPKEIANAMIKVLTDTDLKADLQAKAAKHILNFTPGKCAVKVMEVYKELV